MQYRHLQMSKISFVVVWKTFIKLKHIKIFNTVHISNDKTVSKEAPEYDY